MKLPFSQSFVVDIKKDPWIMIPFSTFSNAFLNQDSDKYPQINNQSTIIHSSTKIREGGCEFDEKKNTITSSRRDDSENTKQRLIRISNVMDNSRVPNQLSVKKRSSLQSMQKTGAFSSHPESIRLGYRNKELTDTCRICGDKGSSYNHYGGKSCCSCRAFFKRTVEHRYR